MTPSPRLLFHAAAVAGLVGCAASSNAPVRHAIPSAPGPVRGETIARLGGSGELAPARLWDAVRAQILGLERCYADRVAARPGLAGRVVTAIAIGPDGRVTRGAIREDQVGDEGLLECARGLFRRLRVQPPPTGGTAAFELALRFDPFALPPRPEPEPEPEPEPAAPNAAAFEAVVQRTLRYRVAAIRECYESLRRADPSLAGTVAVHFAVVERGTVENVRVTENTSGSEALAACVTGVVARFRFATPPEGGPIEYDFPFTFPPPEPDATRVATPGQPGNASAPADTPVVRGRIRIQGGGTVSGEGDFDPAIVARTLRVRLRALQRCYEDQLRQDPTLRGQVLLRFTLLESGTIDAVEATENSTGSAALVACFADVVRRFRFQPGPEGGSVTYEYPIIVKPQT